jgi:hypothetical protein
MSTDEFVDLIVAAFEAYPLGSDIDMETRQHCVAFIVATRRKILDRVQYAASHLGLTFRVWGNVNVENGDLWPTQYLLQSGDRSVNQAFEDYGKAIAWIKCFLLSKPTRDEAKAIADSLCTIKDYARDRGAVRI